jgi:ATP-dependent Clp protease ATP-binding subunit ClpX
MEVSDQKIARCSFCGRPSDQVKTLIKGGDDIHICNECVDVCNEYLDKEKEKELTGKEKKRSIRIQTPKEIYSKLCEVVIGQERAKKVISVCVYKHYQRILNIRADSQANEKENILLLGPTGSGKTLIARTLAEILDIPVSITDATALTEAGYVGEDVESVLAYLYKRSGDDVDRTEKGIVYIDEIDKIARKQENPSVTRDVSGEGVQQALLNMFGSGVVRVDPYNKRKNPSSEFIEINTRNILFICGGSFEGIEKIVLGRLLKRSNGQQADQFLDSPDILRQMINQDDLVSFGFIPEFAARLSTVAQLASLGEDELVQILLEPKNSLIKQYERFFSNEGIEIAFERDAIKSVARLAFEIGSGARGLRAILDDILLETIFEAPSRDDIKKIIVNRETIIDQEPPILLDDKGIMVALKRSQVFISYSRRDSKWLEDLHTFLTPMIRNKTLDVWFDKKIKPSEEWRNEINSALAKARVAVLLVSPNFLASEFAMTEELPYFLKAAKKEHVKLMWILVGACLYEETELRHYQAAHDISKPLDTLKAAERRETWVTICNNIKSASNEI